MNANPTAVRKVISHIHEWKSPKLSIITCTLLKLWCFPVTSQVYSGAIDPLVSCDIVNHIIIKKGKQRCTQPFSGRLVLSSTSIHPHHSAVTTSTFLPIDTLTAFPFSFAPILFRCREVEEMSETIIREVTKDVWTFSRYRIVA